MQCVEFAAQLGVPRMEAASILVPGTCLDLVHCTGAAACTTRVVGGRSYTQVGGGGRLPRNGDCHPNARDDPAHVIAGALLVCSELWLQHCSFSFLASKAAEPCQCTKATTGDDLGFSIIVSYNKKGQGWGSG
eukprot:2906240-Rhodomonas_salina.1